MRRLTVLLPMALPASASATGLFAALQRLAQPA